MCDINIKKDQITSYFDKQIEGKSKEGIAIIHLGGPGSGKNTLSANILPLLGFDEKKFVSIDPDYTLDILYQHKEPCRDSANDITDFFRNKVTEERYNYILYGTGRKRDWVINKIIQNTRKQHYKIYLSIVLNDVNIIIPRIIQRTLDTGRVINIEFIKSVYSILEQNIPEYINLDCEMIDGILVVDNSSIDVAPRLLYKSFCNNGIKSVKCYDVDHNFKLLDEFCPFLWKETKRMICHGLIIAILLAIVSYYVIFVYKLQWYIIPISSVIITYCTAKIEKKNNTTKEMIIISLLTAASIFLVLLQRFNVPESMGVSLLSGMITGSVWHAVS